jgi:hypothetical protein
VNLCYCDESGTGEEPIATMVGIIVDAARMHLTKQNWEELLTELSHMANRQIRELHTTNFYAGNGIWRDIDGPTRAAVITAIIEWLAERKHHLVYTSVVKASYFEAFGAKDIPDELNTVWRFMGFHLVLAMQRHCQREQGVKGHSIFIFDNNEREKMRFTDVIRRPAAWSDRYYDRGKKQNQLDHIVDVPYFGDSQDGGLIQLADLAAFILRRYAEIKEGLVGPRYDDEEQRVTAWAQALAARAINTPIYPKRGRQYAHELFFRHAPQSIRALA